MDALRVVLFVALAALAAVGGWLLYAQIHPEDMDDSFTAAWDISASSPILIGTPDDRFAYAGAAAVQTASGTARVLLDSSGTGTIEITIRSSSLAAEHPSPSSDEELHLRARAAKTTWEDVDVNGATGRGETRLPNTHAALGGAAEFEAVGGGLYAETTAFQGNWLVADAIRRKDGSIRQNGLVFSPLLREKKGFSDPSRIEFTLLLYGTEEEGTSAQPVLLHVVFREVQFERVPEGVTRP
jgi:hypothetical protein